MKNFVKVLAAALCVVLCSFGLVACDTDGSETVEVTEIALDRTELTLIEGEADTLVATITPANATDQAMEWSSSDNAVATVDYGSVVAVAEGKATITVTTSNGKTASCTVTVEAEAEEPPEQYTVTFYAQGGQFENGKDTYEMQITDGEKLSDVTVTRGDKYIFTNWYRDEYRNELWNLDEDTVTEDVRLFAGWKYLNKYQTVIDALAKRITTERQDESAEVEILSIFKDNDGYLCFIEKDDTGVFSYKTGIYGFDEIVDNAEIISAIPNTTLTQLEAYDGKYTSENNAVIADSIAYRYSDKADNPNEAIIYSSVSEREVYSGGKYATGGPWYGWRVKAIVADADGKVYFCSFIAVAGVTDVNAVINGLNDGVELVETELGDTANDFYAERLMELEA